MADKQGFLTKEGGTIKTWKRRWCVFKNSAVYYSKSQSSGELGVIPITEDTEATISQRKQKNRPFMFEIQTPGKRTYFMSAETEPEMKSWIDVLQKSVDAKKKAVASGAPKGERRVGVDDFELMFVIGKGSFGKVMQVKKKDTGKIYAMKVLNKKTIVDRNELEHTKAEKNILQKLVHPFLVNLNYSFQTEAHLYFIMDYVNGGEMFFHLQKDERFDEERARFYSAEIVLGLEYLHANGVLYRDLKPENLLLTHDGHICMTDFGISKEGLLADDSRTATFCGTPEYLAPEVLVGKGYGKAVDWWSVGTLMFEMLTGLPPFYSQDVQQMYGMIMNEPLKIPDYVTAEAKDLLTKFLERDPSKRLQDPSSIKAHPFFKGLDWDKLVQKEIKPPYIPPVKDLADTSLIDKQFLEESPSIDAVAGSVNPALFDGFTYVNHETDTPAAQ